MMARKSLIIVALFVISIIANACAVTPPTAVPATPTAAPVAQAATQAPAQPTAAPAQPTAVPAQPTVAAQPTAAPVKPTTAPAQPTAAPAKSAPDLGLPEVNPLEVKGDIVSAGSSTVFPLAEVLAQRFEDEGYSGKITIDSIGSGAGFERFCKTGETDIANASRPIKSAEVELAKAIGRTPIEFRLGTDALAVVVSKENTFAKDVTLEELALLFGTATNWSDVRAEWPKEPIQRFIPGTDSGTFDYFVEMIFAKDKAPHLGASNTQLSEDDNVLVQGVLGSQYAIGYFGFAYYAENMDKMNVLSINGVTPNKASVDAATYPLARPLFVYSDAKIMKDKPQVAAYINFMLTNVDDVITEVGYFPASDDALKASALAWLEAMK